ncbi:folliculin-interacting protein 2 [Ischnura elegans]|uniref:folliculin-interacting protein 2 n=1 Tax=Ischnura elegans TaxID=197161 RepID=UPI001ED8BDFA|nr:folliculin-interacting protein 2 [Ischnura elegans]
MALLNRLFSTRKKNSKYANALNGKYDGESWRPFIFNREQVRVLLFRECDWRGRKLLFDSNVIVKDVNEKSRSKLKFGSRTKVDSKCLSSYTNGSGNQQIKPSADVGMLGEMIFGSVGMTFKGSAFKVHRMKSSSQLMCSKVFLSPRCHRKHLSSERSLDDSCESSLNCQGDRGVTRSSSDNGLTSSRSGPLDVPWNDTYSGLCPPGSSYAQPNEEDSGFCGDTSLLSVNGSNSSGYGLSSGGGGASWSSFGRSVGPPSNHGSGSLQSMQRRWLRSLHTSIEIFCQNPSMCTCCSGPSNSLFESGNPSAEGLEENPQAASSVASLWGRRPKIGLAVIVTLLDPLKEQPSDRRGAMEKEDENKKQDKEAFFFEHMLVVEEMLDRLRLATEKACHSRKEIFISLIMDACAELQQSILDLFSGPRLSRPVWLGLLGQNGVGGLHHSTIALGFLEQLCQCLSTLDTKGTNFFISTLITAVLTHHLGWVHTIQPPTVSKKQSTSNECSLEGLANSYPYNALWAQLGDLQGNLGYPPRLARTILTGKDTQVLNSLLFILTYFLRCSRIECLHEEGPLEVEGGPVKMILEPSKLQAGNTVLKDVVDDVGSKDHTLLLGPSLPSQLSSLNSSSSVATVVHNADSSKLLSVPSGPESDEAASLAPPKGMRRTKSHVSGLVVEVNEKTSSSSAECSEMDIISEKVQRLCRVPKSAIEYHLTPPVNQESITNRNGTAITSGTSDVVFVLGENERLVGLKKRKAVPSEVNVVVPDVTAAEEVVAGRFVSSDRGVGKVALGDQITALAGEFLSRCKEGIRLAGRAADSIGVVGGQTTLQAGKELHHSLPRKATCDIRTTDSDIGHNGDPNCSSSLHSGYFKNGRVDFLGEKSTFSFGVLSARNCDVKGYDRTHVLREETAGEGHAGVERVGPSVRWCLETRTAECNGVEELVQRVGLSENNRLDSHKKGVVDRNLNVFPLVDTTGLPSFHEVATVELPMPKSVVRETGDEECKCGLGWGLASSLLGATTDHYIPHMVLQGIASSSPSPSSVSWEARLRRDLALSVQFPTHHVHPYLLQELSCSPYPIVAEPEIVEAVCVVGNTDSWEVQVVSSRSCLVDRPGTLGVRVGMSQLVANMLESLLILWRLRTPPEYCLLHLESKLREIWLRSHSLAQLLLTTEFCNMARVTTSLDLEANDVPLLLAVASTHTPQVTLRYGLSFR